MPPAFLKQPVRNLLLAALLLSFPPLMLACLPAGSAGRTSFEPDMYWHGGARFDDLGRLTAFPGKTAIACPKQTERTAVLLVAGQSNAANHAQRRYMPIRGNRIFGFFAGQCTIAQSPLLGASGEWGEIWTPLADRLIASGAYDQVVLVPAAIGGSSAEEWTRKGRLHPVLTDAIAAAQANGYDFTYILWYQGETDYFAKTSAQTYRAQLADIFDSMRNENVRAPIYIAVATRCNAIAPDWTRDNAIAHVQRTFAQFDSSMHTGIDADALVSASDRYDNCHLGPSGVEKAVTAWANILNQQHARR